MDNLFWQYRNSYRSITLIHKSLLLPSCFVFSELQFEDLKGVLEEVYYVSPKWVGLGVALGMSSSEYNRIRSQFSDPQSCLREVIVLWLRSSLRLPPTWGTLIDALKSHRVGEHQLAEELRKKYIPTSTEGNNHLLGIMMITALHTYFIQ